ncbi:MAG: hypothetical protein HY366_02115 [Candidatus Aenigmarchaeota archaeon]|nr:hypothetical protein [Candidatus Aenigmarchaeota archaeon]
MKRSSMLHGLAAGTAILGALSFVGFWIAVVKGNFVGLVPQLLFSNALMMFLASIAFGVAALYHWHIEKKK